MYSLFTKQEYGQFGVAIVLFAAILFSASLIRTQAGERPTTADPYVITWEVAHEPVIYFERTAQKFKELVEHETDGRVVVAIDTQADEPAVYGNGQFQSFNAGSLTKVQAGDIQMSQIYIAQLANLEPAFNVLELPFIFSGHDHVKRVVESDIGSNLLATLSEHGLKGLGFTYSGGLQVIVTTGQELRSLEDFDALTYRAFGSDTNQATMDLLGTDYRLADRLIDGERRSLAEQLATGVVAAGDATYVDAEEAFFGASQEVATVFNQTHHKVLMTALVFNQDAFDALPSDIQSAIETAAFEAARLERAHIIADEALAFERIKAAGHTIVELTDAERSALETALAPVRTAFMPIVGAELITAIENF